MDMKSQLIEAAHSVQGTFNLGQKDFYAGSVGAALVTDQGNMYTGICIDVACGMGFCAEHSAIAEMLKQREVTIKMIVAMDNHKILAPCGRCREMMIQVNPANAETEVILSQEKTVKLKELLPYHSNS